jgi:hypothetical protein
MQATEASTSPIVLLEVGTDVERSLRDLVDVRSRRTDSLVLVVDPSDRPVVRELALELGAVHVASGLLTAPEAAAWLERWITLAADRIGREGWTRKPLADPIRDPIGWLAEQVSDARWGDPARES